MESILAVILFWGKTELTRRCIISLVNQKVISCDVLIIDNHSKENFSETFRKDFPTIQIVRNSENLGVSAGRNIGIRYALKQDYQYVLLLDNDACADAYMLSELVGAARRQPAAGILGPKIYRDDSKRVIWRAGCTSWKWTYLHAGHALLKRIFRWAQRPLPEPFDTIRGENKVDIGQFDLEQDIDFQIGCAQLIKTEVFQDVGLLDEEFSPYGSEDIDFCVRAKLSGWRIRYVPGARCWHSIGGSFQDVYQRAYFNTKNLLLLARKNIGPFYFCFLFLPDYIFLSLPLMWLESIFQKNSKRRKAIIEAVLWNLRDIKQRGVLIGGRQKKEFTDNRDGL